MKIRYADRSDWTRVTKRKFSLTTMDTPEFTGHLSLLQILEVTEPLHVNLRSITLTLADTGYHWLQYFPFNACYAVTTMINAHRQVVQWYLDVTKPAEISSEGIPFHNDLYLDIAVLPSGELVLLDEDELEEAFARGEINRTDYDLSRNTAAELIHILKKGPLPFMESTFQHLDMMLKLPRYEKGLLR